MSNGATKGGHYAGIPKQTQRDTKSVEKESGREGGLDSSLANYVIGERGGGVLVLLTRLGGLILPLRPEIIPAV